MAMVVKNNMSAVRTLSTLNTNSTALQKSLAKVASGMKINTAQDDASGYAISERMRVQIRSLDQANQNTQNGSSMMKTAEGAVSSTVEILKALKEKAINAANDSNTDDDRRIIQKEMDQFIDQIDDNALTTFNGKYLVDGSKNYRSEYGTVSAFTNQSLATETTGGTILTDLMNRNRESLEIQSTDRITASFVKDGRTYTTTFKVSTLDVNAIFDRMVQEYAFKTDTATYSDTANSSLVTTQGDYVVFSQSTDFTAPGTANQTNGIGFNSTIHNFEESMNPDTADQVHTGDGSVTAQMYVYSGIMIGVDSSNDAVKTADKTWGMTVRSGVVGYGSNTTGNAANQTANQTSKQIAGFTISVTDSQGNVKKAANAAVNAWTETIHATNKNNIDNSLNFQVGANSNEAIKVGLRDMRSEALGLKGSDGTKLSIASKDLANAAVSAIDNALQKALDQQTTIGAVEARLEYTSSNLSTSSENVQAAESTIRDADMAKEMTAYTRNNVLLQAAQSMLAQANQNSSSVLSLLQ
ncbi:MAG: flagellin [Selenomonadaceae bacterium]|nr:flagellin [Selenomonadaceae bacterium]